MKKSVFLKREKRSNYYRVTKLVNIASPEIGALLNADELLKLVEAAAVSNDKMIVTVSA